MEAALWSGPHRVHLGVLKRVLAREDDVLVATLLALTAERFYSRALAPVAIPPKVGGLICASIVSHTSSLPSRDLQ